MTNERGLYFDVSPAAGVESAAAAFSIDYAIGGRFEHIQWRTDLPRAGPKYFQYFLIGFCGQYGNTGLDDAGLFRCNRRKCITQVISVIERNVGDDAELRSNHVGRIETPPQAHF